MALAAGTYSIKSKGADFFVGRNRAEDKSLNPKQVVLHDPDSGPPEWSIEPIYDGNYILRIGRRPISKINNLVFAVLLDEPAPTAWKIEPFFHQGNNTYMISQADGDGQGWKLPENNDLQEGQQIPVATLIVAPSLPPKAPLSELWVITKLN